MINIDKLTHILLFSMLFWPVMSFITYGVLGLATITFYYTLIITMFYGLVFIIIKEKIRLPKGLLYLLFFIIFIFYWSFFTGKIFSRGILPILFDNSNLAIFFIVLIIYNTRFSDRFINKSIFILKITIIIAAITSIVQVFNSEFLNAIWGTKSSTSLPSELYQFQRSSIFHFIDPNSLGLSFMPILSIVTGFLLYKQKQIFILYLLFGGISALLSNARYVMVSFILITLQILIFRGVSLIKIFKYVIITSILLISLLTILNYIGYDFKEWYEKRLFAEGSIKATTRYFAIKNFLIYFPKYYLFGNGDIYNEEVVIASQAYGSSHMHIGYLSHLVAYGVLGCFFLYSFWFYLLKRIYITAKQTGYWGSFFAFMTFFWAFLSNSVSSIFYYGLIFALVLDKYFNDKYIRQKILNRLRINSRKY